MPDLHGWITQQIDRAEQYARDGRPVLDDHGRYLHTEHLPAPEQAAVLRRCEADRRILARHRPQPDGSGFPDGKHCQTCSQDGGDGYQYLVPYPCPTVLDLADGYGRTKEPGPA